MCIYESDINSLVFLFCLQFYKNTYYKLVRYTAKKPVKWCVLNFIILQAHYVTIFLFCIQILKWTMEFVIFVTNFPTIKYVIFILHVVRKLKPNVSYWTSSKLYTSKGSVHISFSANDMRKVMHFILEKHPLNNFLQKLGASMLFCTISSIKLKLIS